MKLDPLVSQIIVATNFDHFTTADVRSLYLSLKNDSALDRSVVRRHIYSELLKLVKKGWLTRVVAKKKGFTRFSKTGLFDPNVLKAINTENSIPKVFEEGKQKKLIAKLNHYKSELLLNIGESEAYKEVHSEFPELVEEIKPESNKAKDNNTIILGKIRAVEGLLGQMENNV